jgi:hypothetical protein
MKIDLPRRQNKTYLGTGRVPQIIRPIHLEPEVVIGMDHLMGDSIFEVSLVLHLICADQDSVFRIETATLSIRAATAVNIMIVEITS